MILKYPRLRLSDSVVLDQICSTERIFDAWSDEEWAIDGAAVRVSIVCFEARSTAEIRSIRLNDALVNVVFPDLTAGATDLTKGFRLRENAGQAFQGSKKIGPFEVSGEIARSWLMAPINPNGRPNSEVLKQSWIAIDVVRSPRDMWIIDFGLTMSENDAALYELPYAHVLEHVRPLREQNNRETRKRFWWRHGDGQPAMRAATSHLPRFIVTPEVAKYRIFRWAPASVLPDCKLMVIARSDDVTFGVLQSRFHQSWSVGVGSWHGAGNDPRYTIATCFETFPFPEGLTPDVSSSVYATDARAEKVATAAKRLNELRETWLRPSDRIRREPEVVPNYPDRILPIDDKAVALLKKRTLTNLYNERPTWLANAHADLDAAVAAAYGWSADISDDAVLAKLFALNQARAASQIGQGELVTNANAN
jgi:type II restriction/modification system DNA methylase subunit YeeA